MKKEVAILINLFKAFFSGEDKSIIGLTQLREENRVVKTVKKEKKVQKKEPKISDLIRGM